MRRRLGTHLIAVLLALAACSSGGDESARKDPPPSPEATGPYVSVAVDNHFHDIHREDEIEIAADRGFVVKNQGRNLHNLTILGTDIAEDIKPGEEFALEPIGDHLDPGVYRVFCRYHDSAGMVGAFEVVPSN
jgi:hypothetical protein